MNTPRGGPFAPVSGSYVASIMELLIKKIDICSLKKKKT